MQTLRRLVFGTDFSEGAEQALRVAIDLAVAAAAPITLVHVCEPDADDDGRMRKCDQKLARLLAAHRDDRVELTALLRSGKPWEKLDNVAVELGASLIVVGRQGAGRGRGAVIGSVAQQLVRSASRPVLTVACNFELECP